MRNSSQPTKQHGATKPEKWSKTAFSMQRLRINALHVFIATTPFDVLTDNRIRLHLLLQAARTKHGGTDVLRESEHISNFRPDWLDCLPRARQVGSIG